MKNLIFIVTFVFIGVVSCTFATGTQNNVDDANLAAPTPNGRNLQPQLANANIDLDDVETVLPPDTIRAILPDEAARIMITAAQAETIGIKPDERVLGVSINGQHHAYPVPFMSHHEIVNAEIGGRSVAVSW